MSVVSVSVALSPLLDVSTRATERSHVHPIESERIGFARFVLASLNGPTSAGEMECMSRGLSWFRIVGGLIIDCGYDEMNSGRVGWFVGCIIDLCAVTERAMTHKFVATYNAALNAKRPNGNATPYALSSAARSLRSAHDADIRTLCSYRADILFALIEYVIARNRRVFAVADAGAHSEWDMTADDDHTDWTYQQRTRERSRRQSATAARYALVSEYEERTRRRFTYALDEDVYADARSVAREKSSQPTHMNANVYSYMSESQYEERLAKLTIALAHSSTAQTLLIALISVALKQLSLLQRPHLSLHFLSHAAKLSYEIEAHALSSSIAFSLSVHFGLSKWPTLATSMRRRWMKVAADQAAWDELARACIFTIADRLKTTQPQRTDKDKVVRAVLIPNALKRTRALWSGDEQVEESQRDLPRRELPCCAQTVADVDADCFYHCLLQHLMRFHLPQMTSTYAATDEIVESLVRHAETAALSELRLFSLARQLPTASISPLPLSRLIAAPSLHSGSFNHQNAQQHNASVLQDNNARSESLEQISSQGASVTVPAAELRSSDVGLILQADLSALIHIDSIQCDVECLPTFIQLSLTVAVVAAFPRPIIADGVGWVLKVNKAPLECFFRRVHIAGTTQQQTLRFQVDIQRKSQTVQAVADDDGVYRCRIAVSGEELISMYESLQRRSMTAAASNSTSAHRQLTIATNALPSHIQATSGDNASAVSVVEVLLVWRRLHCWCTDAAPINAKLTMDVKPLTVHALAPRIANIRLVSPYVLVASNGGSVPATILVQIAAQTALNDCRLRLICDIGSNYCTRIDWSSDGQSLSRRLSLGADGALSVGSIQVDSTVALVIPVASLNQSKPFLFDGAFAANTQQHVSVSAALTCTLDVINAIVVSCRTRHIGTRCFLVISLQFDLRLADEYRCYIQQTRVTDANGNELALVESDGERTPTALAADEPKSVVCEFSETSSVPAMLMVSAVLKRLPSSQTFGLVVGGASEVSIVQRSQLEVARAEREMDISQTFPSRVECGRSFTLQTRFHLRGSNGAGDSDGRRTAYAYRFALLPPWILSGKAIGELKFDSNNSAVVRVHMTALSSGAMILPALTVKSTSSRSALSTPLSRITVRPAALQSYEFAAVTAP